MLRTEMINNTFCNNQFQDCIMLTVGWIYYLLCEIIFVFCTLSLRFNGHFSRWTWVSRYQNVSILDFVGAKGDGGGGVNWSTRHAKLQSNRHHQQTNTHLFNMTDDALPVAQPTVSRHWRKIKALKENLHSALKMLNCNINQDDAIGDDDDETTNANYYFWCEFNQLAFPQFFQVRPSP